jgi:hypothetical protein
MAESVQYVYAVIDADASPARIPEGIDDTAVEVEREGNLAALVSAVNGTVYAGAEVEARSGDIDWLGPRARAHDRVVTWASDRGAAVPFPMFTMFRDRAGVRAMLRTRQQEIAASLARVRDHQEFGVRIFRIDEALTDHLAELSPKIAELERTAASASPGQRYLLGRKIEAERTNELRRIGAEIAQRAYDDLSSHAAGATLDTLPRRTLEGMAGVAVLNASFLVAKTEIDAFRRTLTSLVEEYEPRGFRFEFTGPWPPYHFVQESPGER